MKLEELLDTLDASRLCEIRELTDDKPGNCPVLVPCFNVLDYVGDTDVIKSLEAYMSREVATIDLTAELNGGYIGFIVYVLTEEVGKSRKVQAEGRPFVHVEYDLTQAANVLGDLARIHRTVDTATTAALFDSVEKYLSRARVELARLSE